MKLTFLGTGTSHGIPVIGCHCPVCTSSDPHDNRYRSSILIEKGDTKVIIDTGCEFRLQALRCGLDSLDGVLYTHAHADHTRRASRGHPERCLQHLQRAHPVLDKLLRLDCRRRQHRSDEHRGLRDDIDERHIPGLDKLHEPERGSGEQGEDRARAALVPEHRRYSGSGTRLARVPRRKVPPGDILL